MHLPTDPTISLNKLLVDSKALVCTLYKFGKIVHVSMMWLHITKCWENWKMGKGMSGWLQHQNRNAFGTSKVVVGVGGGGGGGGGGGRARSDIYLEGRAAVITKESRIMYIRWHQSTLNQLSTDYHSTRSDNRPTIDWLSTVDRQSVESRPMLPIIHMIQEAEATGVPYKGLYSKIRTRILEE